MSRENYIFQMACTRQGRVWWRWVWTGEQLRQCSFSSHGALEGRAWCVRGRAVFFLETVIPYLLSNVFSVESSVLSAEVQFQIETQYCDGFEAFRTNGSFHSSRNRSCDAKNVGACDAGVWWEAANVCPARRTTRDWHYFQYLIWYVLLKCIKTYSLSCN